MSANRASQRIKACIECRQQKLRCDAHVHGTRGCSRCDRLGIQCIVSDRFHRSKRQSKAEMQRELDQLRAQVDTAPQSVASSNTAEPSMSRTPASARNKAQSMLRGVCDSPDLQGTILLSRSNPSVAVTDRSKTRVLDGLEINGQKISDCFALFFMHYHGHLPLIEETSSPDACYTHSRLTFWTIVAIGSRRFSQDPTILDRISCRVISLALRSSATTSNYLEVIQSLVLLCHWPVPKDTMYNDVSHVLAGAAMQLAIQNGLHMFTKAQDFTKHSLNHDVGEEVSRAKLWIHCKIICQRLNVWVGLYPFLVPDALDYEHQHSRLIESLPMQLYWSHRLHRIVTKAVSSMMPLTFGNGTEAQNSGLRPLIDLFSRDISDLENQRNGVVDTLELAAARLYVNAFELYCEVDDESRSRLLQLSSIATTAIAACSKRDQEKGSSIHSPHTDYLVIGLSISILLRLAKSYLQLPIDPSTLEQVYFTGTNLIKNMSLQNDDMYARSATMFTQLWPSTRVFTQIDGTVNSHKVRLRNRCPMGIAYDCYWYWVVEFRGQKEPRFHRAEEQHRHTSNESSPVSMGQQPLLDSSATEIFADMDVFRDLYVNDGFWDYSQANWHI